MKKWFLVAVAATLIILFSLAAYIVLHDETADNEVINYEYTVTNAYPHDINAFTEGLVYENGFLYEGTGLYGNSTLRKVELETGEAIQLYLMSPDFFGEGITIFDDKIIQLSWLENTGFVYEKDNFELLKNFSYPSEGWGITTDGENLIMSDGTATLHFLDPKSFQEIGTVEVHDASGPVTMLNELEYVKGDVYANIFEQKRIAIINVQTGEVKGWIDLAGLRDPSEVDLNNVLNGIAYDVDGDRLFVTGKRWTQLFEIKLVTVD